MKCCGLHFATGELVEIRFGSRIESVTPASEPLDAPPWLAPGFIDLQVNGFAGADYDSPQLTSDEIGHSIAALRACGVTRFFPTVITGAPDQMLAALANLAAARECVPGGDSIEAIHLEGPYISSLDGPRGVHPSRWVRPPDLEEFARLQDAARGLIRLVTIAPEWPGAPEFIARLVRADVVVSIGHSAATAAQIDAAVRAGATMSTHLGNAAPRLQARLANCLWQELAEDRLMAGFIADGVHLDPYYLKVALRAKGVERSVLVTDAVAPAGCAPGRYRFGEADVTLTEDNRVVLTGTAQPAGSALSMDRGVENLVRLAGLPLRDALAMATVNPARVAHIPGRQRGLVPGERADVVALRFDPGTGGIRVERTFVAGEEHPAASAAD